MSEKVTTAKSASTTARSHTEIAAEICELFQVQLLQTLLSEVVSSNSVPTREIVRWITSDQACQGSRGGSSHKFSDFKEIFLSMMHSFKEEDIQLDSTVAMFLHDMHAMHKQGLQHSSKALRIQMVNGRASIQGGGHSQTVLEIKQPPGFNFGFLLNTPKERSPLHSQKDRSRNVMKSTKHLPPHNYRKSLNSSDSLTGKASRTSRTSIKSSNNNSLSFSFRRDAYCTALLLVPPPQLDLEDFENFENFDENDDLERVRIPGTLPLEAANYGEYEYDTGLINPVILPVTA